MEYGEPIRPVRKIRVLLSPSKFIDQRVPNMKAACHVICTRAKKNVSLLVFQFFSFLVPTIVAFIVLLCIIKQTIFRINSKIVAIVHAHNGQRRLPFLVHHIKPNAAQRLILHHHQILQIFNFSAGFLVISQSIARSTRAFGTQNKRIQLEKQEIIGQGPPRLVMTFTSEW